jgi:anthranilate synthase component 1
MYYPSKQEFIEFVKKGNLIPIYRELIGDMDTPVSIFRKIMGKYPGYLLESVEGGEHIGRYSFLGINPSIVLSSKGRNICLVKNGKQEKYTTNENPLAELKKIMSEYRPVNVCGLPRFSGGAVGYVAYNVISFFEDIPKKVNDELDVPDTYFMVTDTLIIFDHVKHVLKVVCNAKIDGDPEKIYNDSIKKIEKLVSQIKKVLPVDVMEFPKMLKKMPVKSNFTKEKYKVIVNKAKEYIRAGDIIQVVPSQRFSVPVSAKPFDIYRALRSVNPSPYMYYIQGEDFQIIGSSPELLVRCEGGIVETRPIAGTRPRGKTPEEDEKLEKDLLSDKKECAEHIMLVDLGRNDLGRVCESGTVKVTDLMVIERYSHVMHIVSNVTGKLKTDKDPFDVLAATFPAGTVSGAPKIRAMQIISELEHVDRGPYAGAIGYFSFSGNLDSAITIRTILVKNKKAYIQAGGGIVADSVPEKEYEETVNKAKAMIKAIELAEGFC